MAKLQSEALKGALAAIAPKLKHLLERQRISESELGRQLKRRGQAVSTKTINNLLNRRHSAQLGNLASIADRFGVPLWVMLIPGLPLDMIEGEPLKRLDKLIQDYIGCLPPDRVHPENVAAAYTKRKVK